MSIGDIKNNIYALLGDLRSIHYTKDADINLDELSRGCAAPYLPIYHFLFTEYNCNFSKDLLTKGFELYGKTDQRFIEALYKILRDILCYKPPITKEQFFVTGYAERKILMCRDIIHLVHTQYRPSPVGRPSKSKLPSSAKSQEQNSTSVLNKGSGLNGHLKEQPTGEICVGETPKTCIDSMPYFGRSVRAEPSSTCSESMLPPLDIIASTPVKLARNTNVAVQTTSPYVQYEDYALKCRQIEAHENALISMNRRLEEVAAIQQNRVESSPVLHTMLEMLRSCENRITLLENRLKLLEVKNHLSQVPVSNQSIGTSTREPIKLSEEKMTFQISNNKSAVSSIWDDFSDFRYGCINLKTPEKFTNHETADESFNQEYLSPIRNDTPANHLDIRHQMQAGDDVTKKNQEKVNDNPKPFTLTEAQIQMAKITAMMKDTEKLLNMQINSPQQNTGGDHSSV